MTPKFIGSMGAKQHYNGYPDLCVLLFGVTQCNNISLMGLIYTNKYSIGCLDIIEHKGLCNPPMIQK